jgi:hypothetical protein
MNSWPSSPILATLTLPESPLRAVVLDTDVASRSFKDRLPAPPYGAPGRGRNHWSLLSLSVS